MRQPVIDAALTAIRSETRIGRHIHPRLDIDGEGVLTVEAEVDSVAQKKLALERVAATPGVEAVLDRLHVKPATHMNDGGIADDLRRRFAEEPAFRNLRIVERRFGQPELVRDVPIGGSGQLEFEVQDGIVTLDGAAPSLALKRLAGAMAWWVPGARDVVNGMAVEPDEEDAPILVEEAVRLVLEKNPFVDAGQIRVGVRGGVVRLTGLVRSEAMREIAEGDAWFVLGVDDVINKIEVRP